MRVRSAEGHQLLEREAFMMEIDRDLAVEKEEVKKGLSDANALKEAQEETAKDLAEQEEAIKLLREQLRKKNAALQEEQLLLSAEMAARDRRTLLQEIKEEEGGGLYWLDETQRKEAGAALSKMALLETEVRSRYNTLLRVMALDSLSPQMRQQALRLKEQLRVAVADLEVHVHAAIEAFTAELWAVKAERKLLIEPAAKEALKRGIQDEWAAQEHHQRRIAAMQAAARETLATSRREITKEELLLCKQQQEKR
ncbi:LOW QUALITY PROTEIN: uncharacterized protein EMH_0007440 [Eimeria mitis]|uniref:Uncharacterized protein n=1 Tax=Eimeria mitis TaxID=44415 RepID=U6KDJ1_9EIME|nr:LOW QUALITY PROTEIN: uncharacterized protein EMH_0007440 [Eimeria mitis]CDJ36095.1 hypothetical protein, conserved [Eimeria mitis]